MPSLRFMAQGPLPRSTRWPATAPQGEATPRTSSGREASPSSKLELSHHMKVIKEPGDCRVPITSRGCFAVILPGGAGGGEGGKEGALWDRGWHASEELEGTALGLLPPGGVTRDCPYVQEAGPGMETAGLGVRGESQADHPGQHLPVTLDNGYEKGVLLVSLSLIFSR